MHSLMPHACVQPGAAQVRFTARAAMLYLPTTTYVGVIQHSYYPFESLCIQASTFDIVYICDAAPGWATCPLATTGVPWLNKWGAASGRRHVKMTWRRHCGQ